VSPAKRTTDDYQRMIARANELFAQIAQRHGLHLELDDKSPVEAAATLPKQPVSTFGSGSICRTMTKSE
jgi:hypothetical protein